MNLEQRLLRYSELHPDIFILSTNTAEAELYLKERGWIGNGQSIRKMEKPGEGNMNLVLRVILDDESSFILKQARPWVEKYPHLEAPPERILVEKHYYQSICTNKRMCIHSPKLLGFDSESLIMSVQDLGESRDFTKVYKSAEGFTRNQIQACIDYLNDLSELEKAFDFPENMELRILNHQHIFYLPFIEENGFDLDSVHPGLQELSRVIKGDKEVKEIVEKLGNVYLTKGTQLLHGDFYPGSILNTKDGVKVIDPEFGFIGPAEWDIAIFIAHLYMADTNAGEIREAYYHYRKSADFDDDRFAGFVGTEIIRRIIGLAQLPLSLTLVQKKELLEKAVQWIKYGYAD
ncbi:MAG: phosphotransferase [Balneolales bacterium]|nr:phosphotransferase [Balneolales bacterium]